MGKNRLNTLPSALLIGIFRGYQRFLSPLMGHQCRFSPTCSHYAIEAVQNHGSIRGGWLALRRILKCQPFYRGSGLDPVPEKPAQSQRPTGTPDNLSL